LVSFGVARFLVRFGREDNIILLPGEWSKMAKLKKVNEYLRVKKAAECLGVFPGTLRNWGRTGKIKEYRNPRNGYRLYLTSEIDKILREIEQSAEKPKPKVRRKKRRRRKVASRTTVARRKKKTGGNTATEAKTTARKKKAKSGSKAVTKPKARRKKVKSGSTAASRAKAKRRG
jgi:DNA-binding transcriptional MerR regulator